MDGGPATGGCAGLWCRWLPLLLPLARLQKPAVCGCLDRPVLLPRSALQLMAVGGNGKARQFFKQHGWDEIGSDKIEGKVGHTAAGPCAAAGCMGCCCIRRVRALTCAMLTTTEDPAASPLQYTSRAAQLYKAQLDKEVAKLAAASSNG